MTDEEMTPGYCDLCRTKETEKYNKILKIEDYENEDDYYEAHMICCYEADPAFLITYCSLLNGHLNNPSLNKK